MPKLSIDHRTTYRYSEPVSLSPHRLMRSPRESRELKLISHELSILPEAKASWSSDVFGNAIAAGTFPLPTDSLIVDSRAVVDLTALSWPIFDISASAINFPFRYPDHDWSDLGALTTPRYPDISNKLSEWAQGFVASNPTDTLSLLKDISLGVANSISYQSREQEGTQSPIETLERRWGSCRDLAVLFIEAVRSLGFGARIVSGYLFDAARIGSSDAGSTHAGRRCSCPVPAGSHSIRQTGVWGAPT